MSADASRNHLLAYARKRVEEAVLAPLRADTTTLDVAEDALQSLRVHFRGLWIALDQLRVQDGTFVVGIMEMPR